VIVDGGISRASLRKRARTRWCRSCRAESDRDGQERQDAVANETRVSTPRRESQESRAWLKGRTHRDQLVVVYLEPLGTSKSRNDRFRPEALSSLAAGRAQLVEHAVTDRPGRTSIPASVSALERIDVELLHREHRLHRSPGFFRVGIAE
jgi:hypothetical protein